MEAKLHDYWVVGVQECWLVSPEARTLEVVQRGVDHFVRAGLYGIGHVISSRVLPDLHLHLEDIW
jgi:Uma2 family endonuclease